MATPSTEIRLENRVQLVAPAKAIQPRRARVEKRQASRKAKRNKYPWPHQGKGEIERRKRQIAAGQLTVSNGLTATA